MGFNAGNANVRQNFSWEVIPKKPAPTLTKEFERQVSSAPPYNRNDRSTSADSRAQPGRGISSSNTPREVLQRSGFNKDMINLIDNNSMLRQQFSSVLNAQGQQKHGEKWQQSHKTSSSVYTGKPNRAPDPSMPVIRFYTKEGRPMGAWFASKMELQRSLELRFNTHSNPVFRDDPSRAVAIAVGKFLTLSPNDLRLYASEATIKSGFYEVELSFTDRGKQQAKIKDFQNVCYGTAYGIYDWFKNLKLKI